MKLRIGSAAIAAVLLLSAVSVRGASAEVPISEPAVMLENGSLRVVISPIGARIVELHDKLRGRQDVKMLPHVGGINEVRFGPMLNLDDLKSRYSMTLDESAAAGPTLTAVASVTATEDAPWAATVRKSYTLVRDSSRIVTSLEIHNPGGEPIALMPWVRHLLNRGLEAQPESAHMGEHGGFLHGMLVPGREHLGKGGDLHYFPAAGWQTRVTLPLDKPSNTFGTILRGDDTLKIYNWHRNREDFSTQEVIAAPMFVEPGQTARWEYVLIVAAPVSNIVYASPQLVIGATPYPTGLPADTQQVTLTFAATTALPALSVSTQLVRVDSPTEALSQHTFEVGGLDPAKTQSAAVPVKLAADVNYQLRLRFTTGGKAWHPGEAVGEAGDVVIPLVVGTTTTKQVVYPSVTKGQGRLLHIQPRTVRAQRPATSEAFDVFALPSDVRCFAGDTLAAEGEGTVAMYAARNEYESLQLAVVPRAGRSGELTVTASDLIGPEGSRVRCEGVNTFISAETQIPSRYNARYPVGIYPEALLPAQSIALGGQNNVPLYITYQTPADARPGLHRGVVSFTMDGRKVDVPVTMTVWNALLPVRTTHLDTPSSMKGIGTGGVTMKNADGTAMTPEQIREAIVAMHLKYRLTPSDAGVATPLLNLKFDEFEKGFATYVNNGATKVYLGTIPTLLQKYAANIPKVESYLREKGWVDYFYVRPGYDELSTDLIDEMAKVCDTWKQVSQIPIMETYYHGEAPALYGRLDIYCRGVSEESWVRQRMAAGDRFWRVNAMPNNLEPEPWTIRIKYVQFWDAGFGGTYLWTVKQWSGVAKWYEDPWCDGGAGNLNATLMWPHETGILSTIRLEALRNGIEDNTLLWLLRERVGALEGFTPTDGQQAAALKKARALCGSEWLSRRIETRDDLERLRIEVGDTLTTLNGIER